jgi:hypothetical protein
MTTISALPTAPSRADPSTFASRADAWVAALPTFASETNAVAGEVNSNASAASASASAASTSAGTASSASATAAAAANFKGEWSALTGALAVPASVAHSGRLWVLLSNIADVTAKTPGVASEWQNLTSLSVDIKAPVQAVAALAVDCSLSTYFTKTIAGNSTFTFSNAPSDRAFGFTLELTHTSGTVTWPSSVKWPQDTAPTLTTGKTHLFTFVTDDGGTRWRGAALANYVN